MEQEELNGNLEPENTESEKNFSVLTTDEINPNAMKRTDNTFLAVVFCFCLAVIAVIGMMIYLQSNKDYKEIAVALGDRWRNIEPVRGTIFSDDGHPLAVDIERYNILFDPDSDGFPDEEKDKDKEKAKEKDMLFHSYLKEFSLAMEEVCGDVSAREIEDTLRLLYKMHKPDSVQYVKDRLMNCISEKSLRNGVSRKDSADRLFDKLKNKNILLTKHKITAADLSRLKSLSRMMNLSPYQTGIFREKFNKREYPNGTAARKTVGIQFEKPDTTVKDKKNQSITVRTGLELSMNDILTGKQGTQRETRVGLTIWRPRYDVNNVGVTNGYDVITTIDIELQKFLQDALGQQLQKEEADWGTAIVLDVRTGDVKAIANADITSKGELRVETCDEFYAVRMLREPGSTFKTVALMCMIDDKNVPLTQVFDTPTERKKTITIADAKITDDHPAGPSSVQRILEQSSNIGMARIANAYYHDDPERLIKRVEEVGLYEPLEMEVPSGKHPVHYRKGEKGWSYGGMLMMTYGYTVSFTPMHIAMFYNGIANGGVMVKPRFVSRIEDPRSHDTIFQDTVSIVNPRLCSDKTLAAIRQCLEGVLIRGTGKSIASAKYPCAGKTGTASISIGKKGYDKTKSEYYATFVGYFPADAPRYTVLVGMKTHRGSSGTKPYSGALLSGPVFKQVVDYIYDREHMASEHVSQYAPTGRRALSAAIGDSEKLEDALSALGVSSKVPSDGNKYYGIDSTGTVVSRDVLSDSLSLRGMALSDALGLIYSKGYSACVKGSGLVDRAETSGTKVTLYLK